MEKISRRSISLYAMAALYLGGGIYHFVNPAFYYSVMPEWLPFHEFANYSSGVVEIILGILLLFEFTRRFSAWTIIVMLSVFFFVIHIPMCFHFYGKDTMMFWISVARIPLQIVLISWAYRFARRRN